MSANTMNDDHIAAMNSITAIIAILGLSDTLSISEQVAELKAQRDALAAENAGLKVAISNTQGAIELACAGINDDRRGDVFRDILNAVYIKTHSENPATDSFLAEVRANAIDSLVDIKTKQLADMHPDTHAFGATAMDIRSQINELQALAAQLRKGVQS